MPIGMIIAEDVGDYGFKVTERLGMVSAKSGRCPNESSALASALAKIREQAQARTADAITELEEIYEPDGEGVTCSVNGQSVKVIRDNGRS